MTSPPNPSIEPQVILGRTGLRVGRLALSAGYGIGPEGIELALDRGQNLFYWGSIRRKPFGAELARQARIARERVVIAIQSYSRSALIMRRSVESALRRPGIDRADLLILGFWQSAPPRRIIEAAMEFKEKGRVAHLGISTHSASLARAVTQEAWADFLMIRYNAANREQEDFLNRLHETHRPGIIAFTATRWGGLLDPRLAAAGENPMTASDCYRFCLAHPRVDAVLCGPSNMREWREGLGALDGPLPDAGELARMKTIGDRLATAWSPLYDFGSDRRGDGKA